MCGIAGTFAYHPAAPGIDRAELVRVRDHMRERGPDGEGAWFSADGRVGLAHRRLAIIDLSENAAQPMRSSDGQLAVTFNGEIYNHRELRQSLQKQGHVFRSDSDTEVILAMYARHGVDMLPKLRGMFALALWDARRRSMLLARDPYGIKPLYCADDGWTLRFASQVKALLAGGGASRLPEPAGVAGFFLFGSVPEPFTLYQEIRAVPAGSFLWVADGTGSAGAQAYFSPARVWREAEDVPVVPSQEIPARVRAAVLDSVRHHLVSDVPVGAFLSAGVDSGALVGLATELQPSPATVTLAFEEFRGTPQDEAPLAAQVAARYNTRHAERRVSQQEFIADLPCIWQAMDQPSIDGVNTWFVSKAAKEQGLKVVLSGVGGDELFGGYPSFRDLPRWQRMLWLPSRIPGLGRLAESVLAAFAPLLPQLNPKAASLLRYGGTLAGAYLVRRGLFMPRDLPHLLGDEFAREGLRRLRPQAGIDAHLRPQPAASLARVSTLESTLYLRNQLLRDTDWAAMAHSVEVRTPLVDAFLARELAPALLASTPGQGKALLGAAPRVALPEAVMARAKTGFTTPVAAWQRHAQATGTGARGPWARDWSRAVFQHFDGAAA